MSSFQKSGRTISALIALANAGQLEEAVAELTLRVEAGEVWAVVDDGGGGGGGGAGGAGVEETNPPSAVQAASGGGGSEEVGPKDGALRLPIPLSRQHSGRSGDTLLHIAARANADKRLIDELLRLKSDLLWRNANGQTPADAALSAGHEDMSDYLLEQEKMQTGLDPCVLTPLRSSSSLSGHPREEGKMAEVSEHVSVCIGDVHGCLDHLRGLWNSLPTRMSEHQWANAYIFWLGDYVDKGPDSQGVLEFLSTIESASPATQKHFFIAGNHDMSMATFLGLLPDGSPSDLSSTQEKFLHREPLYCGEGSETMHLQGARWGSELHIFSSASTFKSYDVEYGDRAGLLNAMPTHHKEFLRNLAWAHDVETPAGIRIITTHAGFVLPTLGPNLSLAEQLQKMRDRDLLDPRPEQLCGRKTVLVTSPTDLIADPAEAARTYFVSGHHHALTYVGAARSNRIVIDSCAGYERNPLAAVLLPTHEVVSFPDIHATAHVISPRSVDLTKNSVGKP